MVGEIESAYGVQRVVAGCGVRGVQADWGLVGSCEFLWVLVGFGLGVLSPLEPIRTYQNLLFFCVRFVRSVRFVMWDGVDSKKNTCKLMQVLMV